MKTIRQMTMRDFHVLEGREHTHAEILAALVDIGGPEFRTEMCRLAGFKAGGSIGTEDRAWLMAQINLLVDVWNSFDKTPTTDAFEAALKEKLA